MSGLRIDGYVIVSADGMLADAAHVMPDALKFEGDKRFFTSALDRADLIVHGRHSHEDQPNSPHRKRVIVTRHIGAVAPDPANPRATLWNPAGASFEVACEHAGVSPDIICLSKALTGGYLPLGATVTSNRVYDAFLSRDQTQTFFHGHSFTAPWVRP